MSEPRDPIDSDLLNVEEVSRATGVRPGTIKRVMHSGKLPSRVVGRVLVTTWGELNAWLDSLSVTHYVAPSPDLTPPRWTLYRFFDGEGVLLYVGITGSGASRWHAHSKSQPWWLEVAVATVEHYGSMDELLVAEVEAIRMQRPKYNVVHNVP